jgi:hypothetical protein
MRILRNTLAKQGSTVVLPHLTRIQLLVPEDHSCFVEAQHRRDVGEALVQVLFLSNELPERNLHREAWFNGAILHYECECDFERRAMEPSSPADLSQSRQGRRGKHYETVKMHLEVSWSLNGILVSWIWIGYTGTAKLRLIYSHNTLKYHFTVVTIFFKIEGMFILARDRNAAPIEVASAIAASFPSLVASHLGLDIPVVQFAQWARSITAAAVAHAVDVTAASMPQVSAPHAVVFLYA